MKNKLANMLIKAKRNGVDQGRQFQGAIYFLALNNILQDYLSEDDLGKVLAEIEAESNRIAQEVFSSVPSGEVDEMGEKVVYEVDKIRQKRGMDKHFDRVTDQTTKIQTEIMEEMRLQ